MGSSGAVTILARAALQLTHSTDDPSALLALGRLVGAAAQGWVKESLECFYTPKPKGVIRTGQHPRPEADGKLIPRLSNSRFSKTSLERFSLYDHRYTV
jgi:hypothetical protein